MNSPSTRRSAGSRWSQLGILLLSWTLMTLLSMATFSMWPRTLVGFLLAITVGPVAYLLVSAILEGVFHGAGRLLFLARLNQYVHRRTHLQAFSPLRVGVLLVQFLVLIAIVVALLQIVAALITLDYDALTAFWHRHFY